MKLQAQEYVNLFQAAWSAGIVTLNKDWMKDMGFSTPGEAYDDIVDELIEGRAFIYKASGVIHNPEQPDGGYPVKMMGFDRHGDPSDVVLENVMVVPTKTSIYIDFSAVVYNHIHASIYNFEVFIRTLIVSNLLTRRFYLMIEIRLGRVQFFFYFPFLPKVIPSHSYLFVFVPSVAVSLQLRG